MSLGVAAPRRGWCPEETKTSVLGGIAKAVAFDYATHGTCLGGRNYTISGDVLGLAEQFVEKILGSDVIVPAFAGASGDINPWLRAETGFSTDSGWVPEPVLQGTFLGEEVVRVYRSINQTGSADKIRTAFTTLQLPANVITHCNGAASYLPTKEMYVQDGYEVKTSPFGPQAADIVVHEAIHLLHDL